MLTALLILLALPTAGEPISPPPRQPALLPVPGQADGPDHVHRALRRGPERRLRRHPLPRRAARPGTQPHADVLRHLSRGPRLVQDREEHAGADRREVHRPLAPHRDPRRGRRRKQVRPRPLERRLLRSPQDVRGRRLGARHRRRVRRCSARSTRRTSGRSTR